MTRSRGKRKATVAVASCQRVTKAPSVTPSKRSLIRRRDTENYIARAFIMGFNLVYLYDLTEEFV